MTEQTDAAEVGTLTEFWHEFWTRGGGCMGQAWVAGWHSAVRQVVASIARTDGAGS